MTTKPRTKKTIAGKVHTLHEKQARPTFVTTKSSLEQLDMSYWGDIGLVKPDARFEKKAR